MNITLDTTQASPLVVKKEPLPDWEVEVLQPLRAAQEAARKAEEARLAAEAERARQTAYTASYAPVVVTGNCGDWMAQAGISDIASAYQLIMRESGCNPTAMNPYSGACGIPQALPCSKMGCTWGDPICQLRWMQSYVYSRYGSWANALAHSYSFGWY